MQNPNKTFGLIGHPLSHSWSKSHFTQKFEQEGLINHRYENFDILSAGLIKQVISDHDDLFGLNVTIPFKQSVMSYLDDIDPVASAIGAVNTIRITRPGSRTNLSGYNTDAVGFTKSISPWSLDTSIKALVFGSGGSSLAVRYALSQMGIKYTPVTRKLEAGCIPYESLSRKLALENRLWINCTPVGMFPNITGKLPLPFEYLTKSHFLYDLVYNPEITEFLKMGLEAGSRVMNGSMMLYGQAEASWEIWNR